MDAALIGIRNAWRSMQKEASDVVQGRGFWSQSEREMERMKQAVGDGDMGKLEELTKNSKSKIKIWELVEENLKYGEDDVRVGMLDKILEINRRQAEVWQREYGEKPKEKDNDGSIKVTEYVWEDEPYDFITGNGKKYLTKMLKLGCFNQFELLSNNLKEAGINSVEILDALQERVEANDDQALDAVIRCGYFEPGMPTHLFHRMALHTDIKENKLTKRLLELGADPTYFGNHTTLKYIIELPRSKMVMDDEAKRIIGKRFQSVLDVYNLKQVNSIPQDFKNRLSPELQEMIETHRKKLENRRLAKTLSKQVPITLE